MVINFGKVRFSITWMKRLASRRMHTFGIDTAKITTLIEIGKEDAVGGPIYFAGIGRLSFCCQKYDVDYIPKYWEENERRAREFRQAVSEYIGKAAVPPTIAPTIPEPSNLNVIPFRPTEH